MKPVLLLLVPDGVGVRNFLLEPCGSRLREAWDVRVMTGFPERLLPEQWQASAEAMRVYREGAIGMLLRYALAHAHLCRWDTRAMRFVRQMPVRGRLPVRAMHRVARAIGRMTASEPGLALLDGLLQWRLERRKEVDWYAAALEKIGPSAVLCTHQRPSIVLPVVLAARRLGIPTATFIFSWDNLTSKGRIAAPFDHYLVWSPLMKSELLRYYDWIPEERVHIVGTPQFEAYGERRWILSREDFFRNIGADPARRLICYSGGDTTTCPNEPAQLRAVLGLVRKGVFAGNPQILFRPSPADRGERFDGVRREFPELIYAQPRWIYPSSGGWTNIVPTQEDVVMLANLTFHADVNVNVASTMTLDFALHDRPVVNIGFDVDEAGRSRPWLTYYDFDHYRPVVEFGAARVARSPEELAAHVNAYLADPSLDREGRRKLVELEVGVPVGRSSEAVLEALARIAGVEVRA